MPTLRQSNTKSHVCSLHAPKKNLTMVTASIARNGCKLIPYSQTRKKLVHRCRWRCFTNPMCAQCFSLILYFPSLCQCARPLPLALPHLHHFIFSPLAFPPIYTRFLLHILCTCFLLVLGFCIGIFSDCGCRIILLRNVCI